MDWKKDNKLIWNEEIGRIFKELTNQMNYKKNYFEHFKLKEN